MNNKEFYNKKARFDYFIEQELEAGVQLLGPEIKAIRAGQLSMTGTYAKILGGELYWVGANINNTQVDAQRSRKLLVHKKELERFIGKMEQKNYSLIPLKAYFKNGKLKLLIGLGKGKKKYDKRADIKKREDNLRQSRAIKTFY